VIAPPLHLVPSRPIPATRRHRWGVIPAAVVLGTLAALVLPGALGLGVALVVIGAGVVRFTGWQPHPKAPAGTPARSSVRAPSLIAVDAELAARRLRPLTPAQHKVVERWAARHLEPYEPFPEPDEGEL